MAIERIFLGWDGPALHRAADWLYDRYGSQMGNVLVAVPGGLAGRRLEEILGNHPDGPLISVPQVTTFGNLLESLYTPHRPICDSMTSMLVRVHTLKQVEASDLSVLLNEPPAADELITWLGIARDLQTLDDNLGRQGLTVDHVLQHIETWEDFPQLARWQLIDQLQRGYETILEQQNLADRNLARRIALDQKAVRCNHDLVLLATSDISRIARMFLHELGKTNQITALLHAPADAADKFDAMGGFDVDAWSQTPIVLDEQTVQIVDKPSEQTHVILQSLQARETCEVDRVTIGLGDEMIGPAVARTLRLTGLPTHLAAGTLLSKTRPATLLFALQRYLQTQQMSDLASLIRHPDMERYLLRAVPSCDDLLTLLDDYICDHLAGSATEPFLGDQETIDQLNSIRAAIENLAGNEAAGQKPVRQWAEHISRLLVQLYGSEPLSVDDDDKLVKSLKQLASALRSVHQSPLTAEVLPQTTLGGAISLILSNAAANAIPADGGDPAIQLIGWLELQLDDAPTLFVTSVNEGMIPASTSRDPFLPDSLCRQLGMPDDQHRLARDTMMMTAILNSRPNVKLIASRRSQENDPLAPSRLLLRGQPDDLAPAVLRYYDDSKPVRKGLLIQPGDQNRFTIPLPIHDDERLTELSVTAFRAYLACPYRFYLRYVLKLEPKDDQAVELDSRLFGTLAHEVLGAFGRSDIAHSTQSKQILKFLNASLDEHVLKYYGYSPRAAVVIQCHRLKYRLEAFAEWQARNTADGWLIIPEQVEARHRTILNVDGKPFAVNGQIDRIDHHSEHGYRVLDYKTGDSGYAPRKTHQEGPDNQWKDLQLPLYRNLVTELVGDEPAGLGYIMLPKKVADTGQAIADWSDNELAEATEVARQIIRDIRNGIFWPLSEPPNFVDGYEFICHDRDRRRAMPQEAGR